MLSASTSPPRGITSPLQSLPMKTLHDIALSDPVNTMHLVLLLASRSSRLQMTCLISLLCLPYTQSSRPHAHLEAHTSRPLLEGSRKLSTWRFAMKTLRAAEAHEEIKSHCIDSSLHESPHTLKHGSDGGSFHKTSETRSRPRGHQTPVHIIERWGGH